VGYFSTRPAAVQTPASTWLHRHIVNVPKPDSVWYVSTQHCWYEVFGTGNRV